ncbi:MAG: DUF503 domain-containing protein [Anaerolineae bacterium]|nr:DUF503 domain-containing protein [Anaerolineae bacterium]
MIIGACTLHLYLPGVYSLKEKRSRLRPLLIEIRRKFDVAAAEVGSNDVWQTAEVAVVAVANDVNHIYAVLEKTVHWIEEKRFDIEVVNWSIELR